MLLLLTGLTARPQETKEQKAALALLAKIDGKATFDPDRPSRVIGIDI
jgi:hypothetical protein